MTPVLPAAKGLPSAAATNQRFDARNDAQVPAGPALHLHIGRLAVRGLASAEGRRVADAFQHELQRLVTSGPWPTRAFDLGPTRLPSLQRASGERPETLGRRLARRIAAQWSGR